MQFQNNLKNLEQVGNWKTSYPLLGIPVIVQKEGSSKIWGRTLVDSGCYIAGERGGKEWKWGGVEARRGGDKKLLPQPCNKRDSDAKKKMYTSEARHRWRSVERVQ